MNRFEHFIVAASIAVAASAGLPAQDFGDGMAFAAQSSHGAGRSSGGTSDRAEASYRRGQKAIDSRQWDKAIAEFGDVASSSNSRTDGALYWKAYALNKANRKAEALESIARLRKEHPDSRWLNDAKALELEVRQASGQTVSPEAEGDEDLKMMAINSLMNTDPERALPYLDKILKGNLAPKYKDKALFVLAQSGSPKARQILADIARGGANPDLQLKAIQNLSLFGGSDSRKILTDVYRSSADARVKRAILQGYMVSGDKSDLLAVAKEEKSPELRRNAIQQLGVMGAQDELWQMYQAETSLEVKKTIVQSMFVGGNADRLIELARTEKDAELRRAAIQSLGLMGGKTGPALLSMYSSESDKQTRKKILEAFFLQGNCKQLVEIARKESDPELKRAAVEKLSIMGCKEGTDFLMELLDK